MKRAPRRGRKPNPPESNVAFAPSLEALASVLGVDRRTISNARRDHADDAPAPRADGRYPIAEYQKWFEAHEIKGRPKAAEKVGERELRELILQETLRGKKTKNDKAERILVPIVEVELGLARTLNAFQSSLRAFPGRIAPKLVGLRDLVEIRNRIENELEITIRALLQCEFLEEPAE